MTVETPPEDQSPAPELMEVESTSPPSLYSVPAGEPDSAPTPGPGDEEPVLPTWEDDENLATRLLRSTFVLIAALFLAWSQWRAPIVPAQDWGRWVGTSVLANLVIPVGMVWMFLAQGLTHQHWLKDQKNNAWNYGWNFADWRTHLKLAVPAWLVLLPFMLFFAAKPEVKASYLYFLPQTHRPAEWAFLLSTLLLYMFCWEWFFRGFLLFGLAQGFTFPVAIVLQAIVFGFAHAGKPPVEMFSAFAGGLVLGAVCWRTKSFAPAFYAHALIHVSWAVLVLR